MKFATNTSDPAALRLRTHHGNSENLGLLGKVPQLAAPPKGGVQQTNPPSQRRLFPRKVNRQLKIVC